MSHESHVICSSNYSPPGSEGMEGGGGGGGPALWGAKATGGGGGAAGKLAGGAGGGGTGGCGGRKRVKIGSHHTEVTNSPEGSLIVESNETRGASPLLLGGQGVEGGIQNSRGLEN